SGSVCPRRAAARVRVRKDIAISAGRARQLWGRWKKSFVIGCAGADGSFHVPVTDAETMKPAVGWNPAEPTPPVTFTVRTPLGPVPSAFSDQTKEGGVNWTFDPS